jgi:hypothetical protein
MDLLGEIGHVESRFNHLETVVCQCKIGARFAPNIAEKSFWTHPMVLLGDEAQVDARFGLFGDSANLDARLVNGLRRTYRRLRNCFGCTRWTS